MKTTSIKQKSFVSVFAALVFLFGGMFTSNVANGQVAGIDLFPDEVIHTITQKWGNKQVIYGQDNRWSGFFIVSEPLSNTIYTKMKIDGFVVRDFVVYNDSVFFTGDDHHDNGFYAYFSLNALLSGTINVTYRYLNSQEEDFFGMCCIKAFTEQGSTNVMLIGDRKRNGHIKRCLFNVSNDSIISSYIHSDIEHFDDVEIFDDYVVSVARKWDNDRPSPTMVRFFLRNSTPTLMYHSFRDTIHFCNNQYAIGRVRIQKYYDTVWGILYKNNSSYLAISTLKTLPYPVTATNVINSIWVQYDRSHSIDTLLDVGFNPYDSRLMALCDLHNGPQVNFMAKYNGGTDVSDNNIFEIPFFAHSISDFYTGGFYVSGIRNDKLAACWQRVWYYVTDCINRMDYTSTPDPSSIISPGQPPFIEKCSISTDIIRYAAEQDRYEWNCRGKGENLDKQKQ